MKTLDTSGEGEHCVERAWQKLIKDLVVIANLRPQTLSSDIETYYWKTNNHCEIKDLLSAYTTFPYLHKLKDRNVLINCIVEHIKSNTSPHFVYARNYNEDSELYEGLVVGSQACKAFSLYEESGLLVKPEVANAQLRKQGQQPVPTAPSSLPTSSPQSLTSGSTQASPPLSPLPPPPLPKPTTFVAAAPLEAEQLTQEVSRIGENVLAHLIALPKVRANISLQIRVILPKGVETNVKRIVEENADALRFTNAKFEDQ